MKCVTYLFDGTVLKIIEEDYVIKSSSIPEIKDDWTQEEMDELIKSCMK